MVGQGQACWPLLSSARSWPRRAVRGSTGTRYALAAAAHPYARAFLYLLAELDYLLQSSTSLIERHNPTGVAIHSCG